MATTFQPELPIDINNESKFIMIKDSLKNAKQKLKNIIFTNPGEKLMDPAFGVGIKKYLFEPASGVLSTQDGKITIQNFQTILFNAVSSQVYQYSPDISILNVSVTVEENVMKVIIEYNYRNFVQDSLVIVLGT